MEEWKVKTCLNSDIGEMPRMVEGKGVPWSACAGKKRAIWWSTQACIP